MIQTFTLSSASFYRRAEAVSRGAAACYAARVRCPTLAELPPPPSGHTGWPWTEAGLAPEPPEAGAWPRITVVVPSYQQAQFLEETLRSVLLQGHPDLELLVMDGGSTDGSVDIIRKYAPWIKAWVSEKDGGQSAAINNGWRQCTGELVTWLNSDDLLLPGWALEAGAAFRADPALDLAYCDVQVIDRHSRPLWVYPGLDPSVERVVVYWKTPFAQQGFLMHRRVLEACGYLDEKLHFTMDAEYWLRLTVAGRKFVHLARPLGAFRLHESAKTSTATATHVADMLEVTTHFCEHAPPEMAAVATQARKRLYWNAAHVEYDGRSHAKARRYAVRHLVDGGGWRAFPRVSAMVALSLLGDPGHRILALSRRLRARVSSG
jgi:GT2 family glycosyltransferase